MRRCLWILGLLAAAPALAAEPGSAGPLAGPSASERVGDSIPNEPDVQEAEKVLARYLDLVIQKKWEAARKLVHPKTLEVIAGVKKRLGREQHNMAPQYWAKQDFMLRRYKLENAAHHLYGTIAFDLVETSYRIQERGEDEGEQASYLLGKKDGKWFVVDKKNNNTFDDASIKYEYKGYFDGPTVQAKAP